MCVCVSVCIGGGCVLKLVMQDADADAVML